MITIVHQRYHPRSVNFVLLKELNLFRSGRSSKFLDSMTMKRPLITSVEGGDRNIIDAAAAGIGITPENNAALAKSIESLAYGEEICGRLSRNSRA